ncbi:MAG TPA: peptide deformylase [Bacilli bacterium]|nr:peptide deformylase [Bacilli bacterium]
MNNLISKEMLLYPDIIKDGNPDLRRKSLLVNLPMADEDVKILALMNDYLWNGYNEDFVEKYKIRPGVGLAAPQIDVLKQMFCILAYDEEGELHNYCVVNPKIISHSEQLTFLESGEGCLSVEKDFKGLIHRPKKIKASVSLYDFENQELVPTILKLEGYLAIVFQHEYDHLKGKLFYDHINKENPFFVPGNSQPVDFKLAVEGEETTKTS